MKSCSRCYSVVIKLYDTSIFIGEKKADHNNICWRCARELDNDTIHTVINVWETKYND